MKNTWTILMAVSTSNTDDCKWLNMQKKLVHNLLTAGEARTPWVPLLQGTYDGGFPSF